MEDQNPSENLWQTKTNVHRGLQRNMPFIAPEVATEGGSIWSEFRVFWSL